VKEIYPSLISRRMLILDSIYPHWIIVCYLFWKASRPAYSFSLLIFLSHHNKLLYKISSYDIVIYIIMLFRISHFNGNSINGMI
jgi:hypothetical protein